jgi:hypothetical protein
MNPFEEYEYHLNQIQASAARFLIDGEEYDAANVLLACSLDLEKRYSMHGDSIEVALLEGPRHVYDILSKRDNPIRKTILRAIKSVDPEVDDLDVKAQLVDIIDSDWRQELLDIARGKRVTNQGLVGKKDNQIPVHLWNNLYFRSKTEIKIAEELDRLGVLFFPNCRGRLGKKSSRENREPDFLICYKGKWGILEVDSEAFHPSAAKDHDRDRLFHGHGILVIQHFTATECYNKPDEVVRRFLGILERAN